MHHINDTAVQRSWRRQMQDRRSPTFSWDRSQPNSIHRLPTYCNDTQRAEKLNPSPDPLLTRISQCNSGESARENKAGRRSLFTGPR
jgi:hypothetical protein